jgi:hypothetical protein
VSAAVRAGLRIGTSETPFKGRSTVVDL